MDTIDSIADKFQEEKWKAYCNSLEQALALAKRRIETLETQISQPKEKTTEQIICELEIEKLKNTATMRSLTLEETKRFDLLVKNLILSKETNKEAKRDDGPPINITQSALIAIASLPDPKADDGTDE